MDRLDDDEQLAKMNDHELLTALVDETKSLKTLFSRMKGGGKNAAEALEYKCERIVRLGSLLDGRHEDGDDSGP